jgi:hypothetical protein
VFFVISIFVSVSVPLFSLISFTRISSGVAILIFL